MKNKNLTKKEINGKFDPYEEDGQMVTEWTGICVRYGCNNAELVKNDKGFWVCPTCDGSYGKR